MDIKVGDQLIQTKHGERKQEEEASRSQKRQRIQELRWAELNEVRHLYVAR